MSTNLKELKNDLGVIWGATGIGEAMGLDKRQVFHLLETGQLKGAIKIGGRWAITRDALLENFKVVLRHGE